MPPALAAYWAGRRNPKRRRRHVRRNAPAFLANPRRRVARRRHYRRNPSFVGGIRRTFSTSGLMDAGFVALGMVAPSLVTDRFLPMVGLVLTGWTRRAVQLAVPLGVQAFAPRVLGAGTAKFVAGGLGVCALGVVNDLTGGTPGMVGGYKMFPQPAGAPMLSGYVNNRRPASVGALMA